MGVPSEWLEQVRRQRGAALMGVLNVTPDSFYDGGRYAGAAEAQAQIDALLADGADILDIGAESSRPGAEAVPASLQIDRMSAAVRYAASRGAVVSVDTTSPEVAERALALGATLVNDVSCLADTELARVTARAGATLVLMHSRGPMSKQAGFSLYPDSGYGDVVADVRAEWRAARDRAVQAGLDPRDVWLDPGLGFAKNARQSFELLGRVNELAEEGVPVVIGASRKSFLASLDGSPPARRLGGTIAAGLLAVERGAAVLRVHDVWEARQALDVARSARPALRVTEVSHA